MAKLFSNLQTIKILKCGDIEEVVSNRDDKDEDVQTTTDTTTRIFPRLQFLYCSMLVNLNRIGGGGDAHDDFKVYFPSVYVLLLSSSNIHWLIKLYLSS
ncbi:hypothetical protein Hanom_Chr14g01247801 [Helianthus anomalus]